VYASFGAAGVKKTSYIGGAGGISRVTSTQVRDGTAVSRATLRRGDIVFPDPGHVQIYLGNGQVVHAPHTGDVVRTANLGNVYAARRIIGAAGSPGIINLATPTDAGAPSSGGGLEVFASAAKWISNSHNWLRILFVIVGAGLIMSILFEIVVKSGAVEAVTDVVS